MKWSPPETGWIKINVDTAVNNKDNRVGLGVVACNESSAVLFAASRTIRPYIDVERAEIEAFVWAASLAKDRDWNRIIFEGDAQTIVNALKRNTPRSLHNQVLINIVSAILSDIDSYSFSFCYREENNVAHRVAR